MHIMMQACGKIAAWPWSAISIAQPLIVECGIIYAYNNASSSYTVVVSFSSTTGLSAQHLAMMW